MKPQALRATGITENANGGRDSNELADMIKRRDMLMKDASFIAERAGILENALGSISTGTLAPDLSHVTSLAQYGFNMGEKDNSVERMEKYYNKSLNLQQQIMTLIRSVCVKYRSTPLYTKSMVPCSSPQRINLCRFLQTLTSK